ncbi:hypothetical protein AQI95_24575 [Streptomyces yokosukanensis]|uniref:Uncharacterized protein n=1 Tax=Streptomyces yokosukanensis TaxID=67386 RepID=A0A101P1F3_9ACTN|nr:hypothetical protein [Streptomyces yokosukanensis]KUN03138.1 hypothetical protein AQI95_24575 [Streptomyces yokosukanensis]
MASYVVTAKNSSAEPMVSVQISAISQEGTVVEEIDVVDSVRSFLATVSGVVSVTALKYEQVITNV